MCLTVGVSGLRAGVDSVWEQEKLEATLREMLDAKRTAREASHTSGVSMKAQSERVAVGHVFGYALFVE